jgi:ElaB/YqjD/DUF883 family membrane-anchored ribosome-binding protein
MNESTVEEPLKEQMADYCAETDDYVRRNPGTALLIAVGTGLALGLLVRALRPEPTPRNRAVQLLKDIESKLRDITEPALQKATEFASDGATAVQEGLQAGGVEMKRAFAGVRKRLSRLFA